MKDGFIVEVERDHKGLRVRAGFKFSELLENS